MTMSLGDYPIGAECDPRAPWNQREPAMEECAACAGKGRHWYACDLRDDTETECTELVWDMLPETKKAAKERGENFYRGEVEVCLCCDGEGEVEYDDDYEPDPDDYYEQLREREYNE